MKCINRIDDDEIHQELMTEKCLWGWMSEDGELTAQLVLGMEFAVDVSNVVAYQWTIEEIITEFIASHVLSIQKDKHGAVMPAVGCEPALSNAIASLEKEVDRLKALRRRAYAARGARVKFRNRRTTRT